MPIKNGLARIPVILQDYKFAEKGYQREIFLDYDNGDLYYMDKYGKIIPITKNIRERMEEIWHKAAKIHIIPIDQVAPAISEREENNWYYIVEKEKEIYK